MPNAKRFNPRMEDSEPIQRCNFPECKAACCVYGTWVDKTDVEDILDHKNLIIPHMPSGHYHSNTWFDTQDEPDDHALSGKVVHTTVVPNADHYGGTACIFMRPDYKCALQVAGEASGMHRWRFKPFYCILHPLDLDEHGRITLDDIDLLLAEPASCLTRAEKDIPLKETFIEELNYLIGERKEKSIK